MQQFHI